MEKIRKPRLFDRNMLIVCEDTNTAPNYLLRLKETAITRGCWDSIEILPKPPLDQTAEQPPQNNPHKTPRSQIVQKQHFSFENTDIDFDFSNGGLFTPNQEKNDSYCAKYRLFRTKIKVSSR